MLSVVIPTRDTGETFTVLLTQLSGDDIQLIISDGISSDNTLQLVAAVDANIAIGSPSRGSQLRRGASLARHEWILFIHADCTLAENWRELTEKHIARYPQKAGFFSLRYNSSKLGARWTELMVAWRSWSFIWGWALPYGDQGLLISRKLYDEIGGYPDWPLFEDVKIAEKIGLRRIRPLGGKITTCAAKQERDGFLKRGWRNFKLLQRYKRGDSIENLVRDYT